MQTSYLVKVLTISDGNSQVLNVPIPKTHKVTNDPEGVSQSEKQYFSMVSASVSASKFAPWASTVSSLDDGMSAVKWISIFFAQVASCQQFLSVKDSKLEHYWLTELYYDCFHDVGLFKSIGNISIGHTIEENGMPSPRYQ